MDLLFKGYILTKNKASLMKFKDKDTTDLLTYEEVKNAREFAGVLLEDTVLIDIDDEKESDKLLQIVRTLGLNCHVRRTTRGMHFFFKTSKVKSCFTNTLLACGLTADIKVGCKTSYAVLKFEGKEREILRECDKIDELPNFLLPCKGNSLFNLGDGDGRNQALFNHILNLQKIKLSKDEIKEILALINAFVFSEPLPEEELNTISRDEAFNTVKEWKYNNNQNSSDFFDGKTFKHNIFGDYLINNSHIIKIYNRMHIYENGVYVANDKKIERDMIKAIPDINQTRRKETLSYIDTVLSDNVKMANARYIAFKNGVYDIYEHKLIEHSPNLYITNLIPHEYNAFVGENLTDYFLNSITGNDEEIRALLEEVVGYCFFRQNELRKSFILTGDSGNGKSTFIDLVANVLGEDNISTLDLNALGERFNTAELFGKLANLGDDIESEYISLTAYFKKIASGDRLNAEKKFQDPFFFKPYAKMIFSANEIPRIKDDTGAILNRMVIVPFNVTFNKNTDGFRPFLKYELQEEECLERMIFLAIQGLERVLINQGFTTPTKVKKAIEQYEMDNSPILMFLEGMEKGDLLGNSVNDIYLEYTTFCHGNGFKPLSIQAFGKKIRKKYGLDSKGRRINGKLKKVFINVME